MEVKATISNTENGNSTSSMVSTDILKLLIGADDGSCDTLKDSVI